MLTRLQVSGFKNFLNVDVRFGLFTCIAGPNGAGKSNLFDAIVFLSDLASMPIVRAASQARGTNGRTSAFESLFFRGDPSGDRLIQFTAEMIVPRTVVDDFDREAKSTATLLEYTLKLRLNEDGAHDSKEPIFIEHEELRAKSSAEAGKYLLFAPPKPFLSQFVIGPGKRTRAFIEMTRDAEVEPVIVLSGDKGKGGRSPKVPARRSPQTVLSGVNAISHPTALAARREMQSWRLLQLEPTALRQPDEFRATSVVSPTGEHLPNAVDRIGRSEEIANRLAQLLPDVTRIDVESDESRELRTLLVSLRERKPYTASSLSDGTLRFLALAVLASDPNATGLICMEEPENGIHPKRIPEMLRLVRDLSDVGLRADEMYERNALRQVITSTHSPLVVSELSDDELLMAETARFKGTSFVTFRPLDHTWRTNGQPERGLISKGELVSFLSGQSLYTQSALRRTVRDRLQPPDLFRSGRMS